MPPWNRCWCVFTFKPADREVQRPKKSQVNAIRRQVVIVKNKADAAGSGEFAVVNKFRAVECDSSV